VRGIYWLKMPGYAGTNALDATRPLPAFYWSGATRMACMAAVMSAGAPDWRILAMAGLYSFGAIGIMTLNDFKAVEGDRRTGINSLPVTLGVERAAQLACALMAAPQVVVVGLLLSWGAPWHAAAIAASLLAQVALMRVLLASPREKAPWYNGTGTTLYVLGMLVTAFALRPVLLP
jgi:chlorophyll synthase